MTRRSWPIFLAALALLCGRLALAESAPARDVTAQVTEDTDLDERVAALCRDHCVGNRREGTLKKVTVARLDAHRFRVRAEAGLRNRHHENPPRVLGRRLGGGGEAFDYTVEIEADGILDDRNCMLRIDRITVRNDRLNLTPLARRQEGTVHRIENCRRFLSGL